MLVLNKYHFKSTPINSVSIMRGSIFGNPFIIGKDGNREEVIEKYRQWLWHKIKTDRDFVKCLLDLRGKDLICCCKPKPCHGDVIVRAIKYLEGL